MWAEFSPDGWDKTRIVFHCYFLGRAAKGQAYEEIRKAIMDQWAVVGDQDRDFVKYVHADLAAREQAGMRPRFTPFWERAVQHFQKLVVETIDDRPTS